MFDSEGWNDFASVASDELLTVPTLTEYSRADLFVSGSELLNPSFGSDESISVASSTGGSLEGHVDSDLDKRSEQSCTPPVNDQSIEEAQSCDSVAAKSLGNKDIYEAKSGEALDTLTDNSKDEAIDGSGSEEDHDEREYWTARCVERRRIRVFSKAMSQSVARSIQRRASKMKARRAARRNEALLVESGLSVDEDLPPIAEMRESSNASSTGSLDDQLTMKGSKSRSMSDLKEITPQASESPRSVFKLKSSSGEEIEASIQSFASASSQDASHGELEIYMI